MANPEHLAKLKEGVEAWNQWRKTHPIVADFSEADLSRANLSDANLNEADLSRANLSDANLNEADLGQANLNGADLGGANLYLAYFRGAKLQRAYLRGADLNRADLREADLRGAFFGEVVFHFANLNGANLSGANLSGADLTGADLGQADLGGANLGKASLRNAILRESYLGDANLGATDLSGADLSGADLSGADLSGARLIGTIFEQANLTGCVVYGISVWDVRLEGAIQSNLVVTPKQECAIQVDNLEVAQFVYLLLNNERIRHVIDTITSKVVLILGRFTEERKAVLDALRDELRRRDYLPVLFDFQKPDSKDLTGTVTTLANMARFIIADLTDPSSVPHELAMVVPGTVVPVQPILSVGQREYAIFPDLRRRHHWVLEPYQYESEQSLMEHLVDGVIAPAEAKAKELRRQ
jgi:uncharacterized protein YjbI with pentapeptide repeats